MGASLVVSEATGAGLRILYEKPLDLLPFCPFTDNESLWFHTASAAAMVAGDRRSWSGLRTWL